MEDFIYIIIGVVWIAFSIYKAVRKRQEKASPQPSGEKPSSEQRKFPDARSIFEELMGGQEVKVPEPEVSEIEYEAYETISPKQEKRPHSFQQEYADIGFKGLEKITAEGQSSTNRISFKNELKEEGKKRSGQNRINLRKAIIYSSILERPYS